jgi:hypothetical protein
MEKHGLDKLNMFVALENLDIDADINRVWEAI